MVKFLSQVLLTTLFAFTAVYAEKTVSLDKAQVKVIESQIKLFLNNGDKAKKDADHFKKEKKVDDELASLKKAVENYEKAADEANKLDSKSKKADKYYGKTADFYFDIGTIHQSEKRHDAAKEAFGKAANFYNKAKKEADAEKMENLIQKIGTAKIEANSALTSTGAGEEKVEKFEQK